MADANENTIYDALTNAGFSMAQAAGLMGNMQNESSFNIESNAIDSNGYPAVGLISWNEQSYPNAGTLVTGNQKKDLKDQISFLKSGTSGFKQGVQGSTAEDVAGNFAQYVEVCQGCNPGGAQWSARRSNAQQIFSDAKANKWPSGPGVQTGNPKTQTTSIFSSLDNVNSFFADLISADFWERAGLILFGAILVILGIIVLVGPANSVAAVATKGKSLGLPGASGPSKEQIANKQARVQIARRNTELGERRMALREKAEIRRSSHGERSVTLAERKEQRTAHHKEREVQLKEKRETRIAANKKPASPKPVSHSS